MKLFNRALNIVSLLLLATVFVTGCSTPRGLQHRSHRPIAKVNLVNQSQDVAKFAQLVSSMMVDSTEVFEFTPFGSNVNVKAGYFYTNALSQKCRKARFEGSNISQDFAVCLDAQDKWYYVQPLNSNYLN